MGCGVALKDNMIDFTKYQSLPHKNHWKKKATHTWLIYNEQTPAPDISKLNLVEIDQVRNKKNMIGDNDNEIL